MPTEPGQPVSQAETNAALLAVDAAVSDGSLSPEEASVRKERIRHAVTPHDLWSASGGLAGDPRSGSGRSKAALAAVVMFLALAVIVAVMVVSAVR